MKSLHDASDLYLSQIMFIKWFLIHSNINIENDENIVCNIPQNVQCIGGPSGSEKPIDNHFIDMFVYNLNEILVFLSTSLAFLSGDSSAIYNVQYLFGDHI